MLTGGSDASRNKGIHAGSREESNGGDGYSCDEAMHGGRFELWGTSTSMGKMGDRADDVMCVSQCSVAWPFTLVFIYAKISLNRWKLFRQTSWPSGLRRCVQVAVLIGAGSNPADVILLFGS